MAVFSAPLALRQHRALPIGVRLERFLARRQPAAVALVEQPNLFVYLEDSAPVVVSEAMAAGDLLEWATRWTSRGRVVFATAPPPQDPSAWRPVAHFCSDPLINPHLAHDVWLFAPASEGSAVGPTADCAD